MLTADAQLDCLRSIRAHLKPGAKLVIHVNHDDLGWLADLPPEPEEPIEIKSEIRDPAGNHILRKRQAWGYRRATQTATSLVVHEEVDKNGVVANRWRSEPVHLHCLFPTEIWHLASRAGLAIEAVYGDFFKTELKEDSPEIIFVLRNT